MRARSPLSSSIFVLSGGLLLGMGCLLDASPYDTTGTGTSPVGGGGTTTTSTTGGTGGTTSTTGGTGGTTSTTGGAGGTGGTGGTGGAPIPTSCKEALETGMTASGTVTIDPDSDGAEPPITVYCDQENDGGGWALVYNSIGKDTGGTTEFWNIPYAQRLMTKGQPGLGDNYYCGELYRFGLEYRDDAMDGVGNVALGIIRATTTGIDETTMKFKAPMNDGSLSTSSYYHQFASGWSSPDADYDGQTAPPDNCAVVWQNVTQHYGGCWRYNLGADGDGDKLDGSWGPHIFNSIITNEINAVSPVQLQLQSNGGTASRMDRISRFTRW
jgi:hypothetical protein